jgi:uncharacterized protein YigE (DUF2233 family)
MRVAALALLALLLAGCAPAREPACRATTFEGTRFTVCLLDTRRDTLKLATEDTTGERLRSFARLSEWLGRRARDVRFAMNAGMFDDTGAPIGLYIENGRMLKAANTNEGPGNFHMMPNGVFSVDADGAVRVETTQEFLARDAKPQWATQSGPMLVIGGALHPAIQEDGPSRLIRNGVGVRGARLAVFAISDDPVSFGRFARLFRDELGCTDALFLDGTVSSLWAPEMNRRDAGAPLGPIAVVSERRR